MAFNPINIDAIATGEAAQVGRRRERARSVSEPEAVDQIGHELPDERHEYRQEDQSETSDDEQPDRPTIDELA